MKPSHELTREKLDDLIEAIESAYKTAEDCRIQEHLDRASAAIADAQWALRDAIDEDRMDRRYE